MKANWVSAEAPYLPKKLFSGQVSKGG